MKLVDDIGNARRWLSIRIAALHAAMLSSWLLVPEDLKATIPTEWMMIFSILMLVVGVLGRVKKQDLNND